MKNVSPICGWGGTNLIGRGLRCPVRVLFGKMYAKTKELGPIGGALETPLDSPMALHLLKECYTGISNSIVIYSVLVLDVETNIKCFILSVLTKGQVLTDYYRLMNKHGGYVWIQTCATVICNPKNAEDQNIIAINYVLRY